jgi:L-2,4-diaminobutyrate decarboxylase
MSRLPPPDDGPDLWSGEAYRVAVEAAVGVLTSVRAARSGPYSGRSPDELSALVAAQDLVPEDGIGLPAALAGLGRLAVADAVDPTHPAAAAHLHCAPAAPALAGDLLAAASNASLDSWDQAPVATHLERQAVAALAGLIGFDAGAGGVFTSGGTQSNLMGLLLACAAAAGRAGRDVAADGLGPDAHRWRIFCSTDAHFSAERAASVLGLGRRAVRRVPVDAAHRIDQAALAAAVAAARDRDEQPIALVATAGSTDFGAVDALPGCADLAAEHGLWLHVDAAVGGALLLSDRHRDRLAGLDRADSVAIDFHKLLWQPVPCAAFLVRSAATLAPLAVEVDYLNAAGPGDGWAMPHLVGQSLATSRRFDALGLLLTLQSVGRRRLGALVDRVLDLTQEAARLIDRHPRLALAGPATLATVVFRYVLEGPDDPGRVAGPGRADWVNAAIRERLLAAGSAVVGRTAVDGRVHLKLTLLNPATGEADLANLVALIAAAGADLDGAA